MYTCSCVRHRLSDWVNLARYAFSRATHFGTASISSYSSALCAWSHRTAQSYSTGGAAGLGDGVGAVVGSDGGAVSSVPVGAMVTGGGGGGATHLVTLASSCVVSCDSIASIFTLDAFASASALNLSS